MVTAFEQRLFTDLPRGVPGHDDEVAEARWGTADDLDPSWNYNRSAFFLGYLRGRGIGRQDDRHVFLGAGSRAGKGVSIVVPNLLLYEGSALAIDPKGELAAITKAERERKGQACHIIDPYGANGRYASDSYNPLGEIDPHAPTAVDDAGMIADGIVVPSGGDSHWDDQAKLILRGLILLALCLPEEDRHLVNGARAADADASGSGRRRRYGGPARRLHGA